MVGKIGIAIVYLISILTLAGKIQFVFLFDGWGEGCVQGCCSIMLFFSFATACIHFNYNDVGLTKAIKMYWAMNWRGEENIVEVFCLIDDAYLIFFSFCNKRIRDSSSILANFEPSWPRDWETIFDLTASPAAVKRSTRSEVSFHSIVDRETILFTTTNFIDVFIHENTAVLTSKRRKGLLREWKH